MASKNGNEVTEGRQYQGADEKIAYTVDTTNVGASPTSPVITVFKVTDGPTYTDDEANVMPVNSPSVSGNVITLSLLQSLTTGDLYRIEVKFTITGNVFEHHIEVEGIR